MRHFRTMAAAWLLLATLAQAAAAGWGFSYHEGYAPPHRHHYHHHHHGPPVYAPYGGYVEHYYYAPPPPRVYYPPPPRHVHPRGSIWIGF